MPIDNIIDRRKRQYRFLKITAIIEAAWHDNSIRDSDQVRPPQDLSWIGYEEMDTISLADAINLASCHPHPVTLFLYDLGEGIREAKPVDVLKAYKQAATPIVSKDCDKLQVLRDKLENDTTGNVFVVEALLVELITIMQERISQEIASAYGD